MNPVRALWKTMRPMQWMKNVLIFAALVFDRQLFNGPAFLRTIAGFTLFCLLSSIVYIFNDIADVEADRRHPTKRNRPIPSGQLGISTALAFAVVLLVLVLIGSYLLSPSFALIALIYFITNLLYSKWLKHVVLLDVLLLAGWYVMRVMAGVMLIEVERFSPWLYVVTTMLALYLGFGKRRGELSLMAGEAMGTRPVLDGYTLPLLDQIIGIVSSTTIIAYSLYTFSAPNLPENHTMMLTIPFVLYGIFRYLYLVQVEQRGGAPETVLLADHPLQITIALWGLAVLIIFYTS